MQAVPCVHNVDTKDLAAVELLAMGGNPGGAPRSLTAVPGSTDHLGFHRHSVKATMQKTSPDSSQGRPTPQDFCGVEHGAGGSSRRPSRLEQGWVCTEGLRGLPVGTGSQSCMQA